MKNIFNIAKKEWHNYFYTPTGYVFAALLLVVTNFLFFQDFFILGQANMEPFWSILALLMSLFVPAIAMNSIAEEKRTGTWEVLLSLPISEIELVAGKFLGSLLFVLLVIGLTIPTIITVMFLGRPDLGVMVGGVIGMILLAAAYLSTGIFCSSLSNQPVAGFMVALIILLTNNLLGQETVLSRLPEALKGVVSYLSIAWHSNLFAAGLIRLSDLVFFLSWVAVFLLLTVLSLKLRDK